MKKKGLRVLSTAVLLGVGIASTMSLTGCKKDPVESQAPASSGTTVVPQPSSSSSSSSSTTAPQPSSSSSSSSEEEKEFNLSFVSKYGETPTAYKTKTIELPQMSDVTYPYGGKYVFGGWYLDDSFENEAVAGTKLSADAVLYAKWTKEVLATPTTAPSGYEVVTKNLSGDSLEAKTYADGYSDGTFIISKGTTVRNRTKTWSNPDDATDQIVFNKSVKIGNASNLLSVESQGEGVLEFYVQNGSSGVQTRTIKITNPDGSVTDIVIPAGDAQWDYPAGSPVVKISYAVGKGTYSINRDSGTIDIYAAKLTTVCEVASETGFKITDAGTTEFIEGQQLDLSKMRVDAVFGNGRTETIPLDSSDLVIDSSAVLMNTPGKYQISVKYKDYEAQTIDVIVYEIVEIKTLGFNATEKN
ncbi:MAG: bacterial Ig-like domain-containing protein [Clostridium sp.]|nr:MAG: bacterial Ig-like domain-containing protein [Clostridium sp.]